MSKETQAIKECIEHGHDLSFESYWIFGTNGWGDAWLINITWKCTRCGFVMTKRASKKEIKAIGILNLRDTNEKRTK